ncbi:MAG: hypothetical protein K2I06_02580 [Ruminococcus sp.]|nr:hypothetical protein [Ruminococcus sp.]
MSFYVLDGRNNGYPCISELQDMNGTDMKKPYNSSYFMAGNEVNGGYPSLICMKNVPKTDMKIPYPHGAFICLGDDFNDGYPFIAEINNVGLQTYSSIYFGENHISKLYLNGEYITKAYCNEQEVFSVKYIKV